jgi:hypothetical protein
MSAYDWIGVVIEFIEMRVVDPRMLHVTASSTIRAAHLWFVDLDDNAPSLLQGKLYQTFLRPSPSRAVLSPCVLFLRCKNLLQLILL